jgi:hypothetical protein
MPYEKSLDVETFKEVKDFADTRLTIAVFSYNGGVKKLQLTRENQLQTGEWRFTKLGRLSKTEAQEAIPLMLKALESM